LILIDFEYNFGYKFEIFTISVLLYISKCLAMLVFWPWRWRRAA